MSTPKDIVVSLVSALDLEKAGWPQTGSIFYRDRKSDMVVLADPNKEGDSLAQWLERFVASPTAEEIMERLPAKIPSNPKTHFFDAYLNIHRLYPQYPLDDPRQGWMLEYKGWQREYFQGFGRDTLCNAAAAMWIYLKQNNLLPKA